MKIDQDNIFFIALFIFAFLSLIVLAWPKPQPSDPIAQRIQACDQLFQAENIALCLEKIKGLTTE